MVETVDPGAAGGALADAARLLHDFNVEYDDPAPPPDEIAARLGELIEHHQVVTLLARESEGLAVGVAVMRLYPSVWSQAQEAYLAELYVVPDRRGHGFGRELITEAVRLAQAQGADYMLIVTSEDDVQAQRLYEAAGFQRTEGAGGPLMVAFEREL